MSSLRLSLLSLLALAACSTEASTPVAVSDAVSQAGLRAPFIHRVTVGGPDICQDIGLPLGCDYNMSLVATEGPDGVSGQWQDGPGRHFTVDCLEVAGNVAWIGGATKDGYRQILRVVDMGASINPPDSISFGLEDNFPDDFGLCHKRPRALELFFTFAALQGQVRVQ